MSDNELEGLPLDYLIGADGSGTGIEGRIREVSYDSRVPPEKGLAVKYCNLFNEKYDEQNAEQRAIYGPYLHDSDTAQQYDEGQIDPRGPGWDRNLREQFTRAKDGGFLYVELDNPDAYSSMNVIGAVDVAQEHVLRVIAKNPLACNWNPKSYIAHSNVYGVIVERGAGNPDDMHKLRVSAGKPTLPVWFVTFGHGKVYAHGLTLTARHHYNMGVTYSRVGEYGSSEDILRPIHPRLKS